LLFFCYAPTGSNIVFGEKALRNIFALSLAAALVLPLSNIYLVYPLFSRLITDKVKEDAVTAAERLKYSVVSGDGTLKRPVNFKKPPEELKKEFGILKISVLSEMGEVLYSTDPGDTGEVMDGGFFAGEVAAGRQHSDIVEKELPLENGGTRRADIVETYVPIIDGGRFIGAFGIYYDITGEKKKLDDTVLYSSLIPFASAACFTVLIVFLLLKASRNIQGRRLVEEELRAHKENLESAVSERTGELKTANVKLETEIDERRQAEEALRRSGSFLNTIFDSIHDPFCIFDREFRIVRVNEGYAALKNMSAEELQGRKCYEALDKGASVCEGCVVQRTIVTGEPCIKDKRQDLPGEGFCWVEIYTYPIFADNGLISHVIEYTRDITGRKKTEMERDSLINELEYLSSTDGLTGLLNRRALLGRLENELDRARRYGAGLSLIVCDVDCFKDINDSYGHLAGDSALRYVARTLMGFLRKSDIAGRYGGDEFMIILPETDSVGALSFAERIRSRLEKEKMEYPNCESFKLSLSLGVSTFSAGMEKADDLIVPADDALYESKQAGRNVVTMARPREIPGIQPPIPFE
jgi:diguanylate cyclase (GGDEF)-like protein/PAS domain S-box-containing protein